MNKKITATLLVCIFSLSISYLVGAYNFSNQIWPIKELIKIKRLIKPSQSIVTGVSFSNETPLPRLISFPDKKEM